MVHLNYYGIPNKYLLMLLCNSIVKLVNSRQAWTHGFVLDAQCTLVQYVINSFDLFGTRKILIRLFFCQLADADFVHFCCC